MPGQTGVTHPPKPLPCRKLNPFKTPRRSEDGSRAKPLAGRRGEAPAGDWAAPQAQRRSVAPTSERTARRAMRRAVITHCQCSQTTRPPPSPQRRWVKGEALGRAQGRGPCRGLGSAPSPTPQRSPNKRANSPQGYEASGYNTLPMFARNPFPTLAAAKMGQGRSPWQGAGARPLPGFGAAPHAQPTP